MLKKQNFRGAILVAIFSFVLVSAWAAPKTYTFTVTLQSIPENAKVYYNDKLISTTTPATVTLNLTKKEVDKGLVLSSSKTDTPTE
ncbi:MAG: hypothetical protein K2H42_03100 [Alistipes sp.]|nr:hypothetical protein [Alistipes sp.]